MARMTMLLCCVGLLLMQGVALAATVTDLCSVNFPAVPFGWKSSKKVLSLTFDDGPDPLAANHILDVLKEQGVPAAFFINSNAGWTPLSKPESQAVIKRILAEGHELASHTATHADLANVTSRDSIYLELEYVIRNVSQILGPNSTTRLTLFRAPYGSPYAKRQWDDATKRVSEVVARKHLHVGWSFEGQDYLVPNEPNGDDVLFTTYGEGIVKGNYTGPVLLHSHRLGAGGKFKGLNRTIAYLKQQGYKFVKVEDHVQEIYGMSSAQVVDGFQKCMPVGAPFPDLGPIPPLETSAAAGLVRSMLGVWLAIGLVLLLTVWLG